MQEIAEDVALIVQRPVRNVRGGSTPDHKTLSHVYNKS